MGKLSHARIDSRLDAGIDDPAESLYDNELQVGYSKGSILLYQLGTWHRGTPVQLGGMRRSGHFCFRTAEADWVGGDVGVGGERGGTNRGWARIRG